MNEKAHFIERVNREMADELRSPRLPAREAPGNVVDARVRLRF